MFHDVLKKGIHSGQRRRVEYTKGALRTSKGHGVVLSMIGHGTFLKTER